MFFAPRAVILFSRQTFAWDISRTLSCEGSHGSSRGKEASAEGLPEGGSRVWSRTGAITLHARLAMNIDIPSLVRVLEIDDRSGRARAEAETVREGS